MEKAMRARDFTPPIFTCATHLHGTVQILLQISVMSAVENLAQFRGFRVNKRRILASFCPFKNLSRLLKTGYEFAVSSTCNKAVLNFEIKTDQ